MVGVTSHEAMRPRHTPCGSHGLPLPCACCSHRKEGKRISKKSRPMTSEPPETSVLRPRCHHLQERPRGEHAA